jgi:hypothetical protein
MTRTLSQGLLVALTLHEDIKGIVVLIHGPPERETLTLDGQKAFIHGPFVPGLRPSAPEPISIILPELTTPLTDGFIGHDDAAFRQPLVHVAVAQGEARVEPDPMADDFRGKAVLCVALGVGRRVHVWLPVLVSIGYGGDIIRVIMSQGRKKGQQVDEPQPFP